MLKFEEGQTYICIHSEVDWWTPGKEYSVFNTGFGIPSIRDDRDILWHDVELGVSKAKFILKEEPQTSNLIDNQPHYKNRRVEIVADSKEEPFTPTIEIDFLIDYIEANYLESNEIVSFLKGHKKGQVFIHETLN